MKYNKIIHQGPSPKVQMGPVQLKQPLPTQELPSIDPFVLLHHYGPYQINEQNNPFDLGPHPHRGFEPITFLIQGEQLHRDSLGNESLVKAGDVQWTTAGRGIIHAEGPSKEFVKKGGTLEGIQLWLNLPSDKKMMPARYQHVQKSDIEEYITEDDGVRVAVIAGNLFNITGKIETHTPVNAYQIKLKEGSNIQLPVEANHQSLLYLLNGKCTVNKVAELEENQNQLVQFDTSGEGFLLEAQQSSKLLFLSGQPINEKVASWGPYVMNTQTEIMEALRDYQQGKMGYLSPYN